VTREKGIIDFVHAIPQAAEQVSDLKFSIVGSGPLSAWVNGAMQPPEYQTRHRYTLTDWVETHIVDCYNELKLFIPPTCFDSFPTSN
jgi:glycosyltransferase involved in cell wall biosynthesis